MTARLHQTALVGLAALALAAWLAGSALGATDQGVRLVDGLAVYIGVLPAEMLRGHPTEHPEATMHGGPRSSRDYHLVVAIFETASGKRVEDAQVTATVGGIGHVGEQRLHLKSMRIANSVTYGGFFTPSDNARDEIAIEIRRPGQSGATRAEFIYPLATP